MRLVICALIALGGSWAQAYQLADLEGAFEGPAGCMVEVGHWQSQGSEEITLVFRLDSNTKPAVFFLNERNKLSERLVGFRDEPVDKELGFVDGRADLTIHLDHNHKPVHFIYQVWNEVWGVPVPGTHEEYVCNYMEPINFH